jgi:hypothetical protein
VKLLRTLAADQPAAFAALGITADPGAASGPSQYEARIVTAPR